MNEKASQRPILTVFQLVNSLPDSWAAAMNPPLEKLLQLQRVRTADAVAVLLLMRMT
jgi:hypothetical protein